MNDTKIQWTDHSASLLKYRDAAGKSVWGCVKKSDGCKNCYSESIARRWNRGGPFSLQQMQKLTPYFDYAEAVKILRSNKLAGKRVFIDDMTDLFGDWVPDEIIDKHFAVFALRPDVTFQCLTKRIERAAEYLTTRPRAGGRTFLNVDPFGEMTDANCDQIRRSVAWPLPNCWIGASIENQQTADERIPWLLRCPAAVRFLSVEPQIGPVDTTKISRTVGAGFEEITEEDDAMGPPLGGVNGIHWVIQGGESGHKARPFNVEWARSLRDQCKAAGVAYYLKQLGAKCRMSFEDWRDGFQSLTDKHGFFLDGPDSEMGTWSGVDSHGGDPAEWAADLQDCRAFPMTEATR